MKLGKVLQDYAYANKMTIRDLGKEIGVNHSTLFRLMNGQESSSTTIGAVMRWLFS